MYIAPPSTNTIIAIMNISTGSMTAPPYIRKVENSNKEFPTLETEFILDSNQLWYPYNK